MSVGKLYRTGYFSRHLEKKVPIVSGEKYHSFMILVNIGTKISYFSFFFTILFQNTLVLLENIVLVHLSEIIANNLTLKNFILTLNRKCRHSSDIFNTKELSVRAPFKAGSI